MAQLDDDMSGPATLTREVFSISTLQLEDTTCVTLLEWIRAEVFPPGMKLRAYARKCACYGITVITWRFFVWWSFGPESHTGQVESSALLVWDG